MSSSSVIFLPTSSESVPISTAVPSSVSRTPCSSSTRLIASLTVFLTVLALAAMILAVSAFSVALVLTDANVVSAVAMLLRVVFAAFSTSAISSSMPFTDNVSSSTFVCISWNRTITSARLIAFGCLRDSRLRPITSRAAAGPQARAAMAKMQDARMGHRHVAGIFTANANRDGGWNGGTSRSPMFGRSDCDKPSLHWIGGARPSQAKTA
mmetsp:Transcript_109826/g.309677  ORF Transcript_109826/g.309677 Transcript_109826/m.309677 type:complete len:210 (-) Transcript_109826:6-635(-)